MNGATIEVNVRFFGFLDEVPESRVTLAVPGEVTLRDLLQILASKYGNRLRERLLRKDGYLPEDIKLVIDSEVIDRLDHKIEDGTTVYVISQIAGGSGEDY